MSRKVTIECKSCKKEVEVTQSSKFKRKYCDPCSAKNKKEWKEWEKNRWKLTVDDCEDDD
ncbi:hypothetical protein CMI40_00560 [Candidatus Pacearchaeota archaeon]|jgi:DNA replicative helicase MCM subunit Mcm2 (Cdc46/Mcm family)|nr:hypothetical protein [Candidatus Pacearchaeota archaeon]|tara:strand:+ start:5377 stop:5556 length:180 start_codon:yes stop_codon:yes gene_type:complete